MLPDQFSDGLVRHLTQPGKSEATSELVSLIEELDPPDLDPIRVVVLFDPTSGRSETARCLAETREWQVLALDSGQAEGLGPAIEELAAATGRSARASQVELAAVVLEALHPLSRPDQPTTRPALRAEELLIWLESRLRLTLVETVLYTADQEALALARRDWDFARRSGRYRLARFSATVQRDPTSQSDLALAQLLDRLIPSGPLPF